MKLIGVLLLLVFASTSLVHGEVEEKYLKDLYKTDLADNQPVDEDDPNEITTESPVVTESANQTDSSSTTHKTSNVTAKPQSSSTTSSLTEKINLNIRFKNLTWSADLADENSVAYQKAIKQMEDILRMLLKTIKVYEMFFSNLREGSVIADVEIKTDSGVKPEDVVKDLNKDGDIDAEIENKVSTTEPTTTTTTTTTTTIAPSGGLEAWTIAVIVICCVLFVLLITLVIVSLVNRHKNRGHLSFGNVEMEKLEGDSRVSDGKNNVAYTED